MTFNERKRHTRGAILLEALVGLAMLLLVVGLATQASTAMLRQQRSVQRQRAILGAKQHLATYALALPYEEVSEQKLVDYATSLTEDQRSPEWNIQVTDAIEKQEVANGKRIRIGLKSGSQLNTARPLVCWRYPVDVESRDGNGEQP